MSTARSIAEGFVQARLEARALPEFPGPIPQELETAYRCQQEAIGLWPDALAGWKIGRVGPPWSERFHADRLVGPIFARGVQQASASGVVDFPVFEGGFAAVEAEFIFRLNADAPADKWAWTAAEAAALPSELHVGVETAGSPLASINDLGPAVIVSDFGNNAGLILGPLVSQSARNALDSIASETFIDESSVGRGGPGSIPGGPITALAFALGQCARMGLPMKAGCLVSTGATTGVHSIRLGSSARIVFSGVAEIRCRAVPAKPDQAARKALRT